MKPIANPFIVGRAVTPQEFLGREADIRKVFGRVSGGQCIAIVGPPRIGKTSFLTVLADSDVRRSSLGEDSERVFFSLLDAQALRGITTQAAFWERAIAPITDYLKAEDLRQNKPLRDALKLARENAFGTFVLEKLFDALGTSGRPLVLMIDEFSDFLHNPVMNSAEFYGGLRSVASRSAGLCVVIATAWEIEELNARTQDFSTGSPYFNIFTPLRLGCWDEKTLKTFLIRAGAHLNARDCRFVTQVAWRHPYLCQAAAAHVWDIVSEGIDGEERYIRAGQALFDETQSYYSDMWRGWTNATRKAITAIALSEIPGLLGDHSFAVEDLLTKLNDYSGELRKLQVSGLIHLSPSGDWSFHQAPFLWWLADELRRTVRDDTEFSQWLESRELTGLLTKSERETLGKAAVHVLKALGDGANSLIQALAKGICEGTVKAIAESAGKGSGKP